MELETWQLGEDGEERGAGDRRAPGDGLRGGDGSPRGIRGRGRGEREPSEDADVDASRRLRANKALLPLAELLGESVTDRPGSGSIDRPPGGGSPLSGEAV